MEMEQAREQITSMFFPELQENDIAWHEGYKFIWNNNQWSYANARMVDGEIVED